VTLTTIASRNLVVFLQEALPAADEAALRQAAGAAGVNLQLVTGNVPPGHRAMIAADAIPGALMELGQAGQRAAAEQAGGPRASPEKQTVLCPP
jgi:hypothetical protein